MAPSISVSSLLGAPLVLTVLSVLQKKVPIVGLASFSVWVRHVQVVTFPSLKRTSDPNECMLLFVV